MIQESAFPQSTYNYIKPLCLIGEARQSTSRSIEHSCGLGYTPNGDTGNPTTNLMLLTLLRRIPVSRLPRSVLLSIPDFAFYNPSIEAVRPRTVDPYPCLKFRRLRSFH